MPRESSRRCRSGRQPNTSLRLGGSFISRATRGPVTWRVRLPSCSREAANPLQKFFISYLLSVTIHMASLFSTQCCRCFLRWEKRSYTTWTRRVSRHCWGPGEERFQMMCLSMRFSTQIISNTIGPRFTKLSTNRFMDKSFVHVYKTFVAFSRSWVCVYIRGLTNVTLLFYYIYSVYKTQFSRKSFAASIRETFSC